MVGISSFRVVSSFVGFLSLLAASPVGAQEAWRQQVPDWTTDDFRFFLHGSMGAEVVPEWVLSGFRATYPALFPGGDLTAFGLLVDRNSDLPIGLSRRTVDHLGGLSAVGINCAACHVAEIQPKAGGPTALVLGVTSHFDAEAFLGGVVVSTFLTCDPNNLPRFLAAYTAAADPRAPRDRVAAGIKAQTAAILDALAAELQEQNTRPASVLLKLDPANLRVTARTWEAANSSAAAVREVLRLFFNMRVALHVPHTPPAAPPPRSGPGRNNAFGVLSVALFGEPTLYGPAKFGVAWNLTDRQWVHWDGNTRLPIVRNLAAALGLGAPLEGKRGVLDFAVVDRHTRLSERIRAARFPRQIDAALAERGKPVFETECARCHVHSQADEDQRLFSPEEIGTDANRARLFDAHQSDNYNRFFAELEVTGYTPDSQPATRSTQKYVAADLAGVWARAPYLHNGSVRTMAELLRPAAARATQFRRGSHVYDEAELGFEDGGPFLFDTTTDGNHNSGHEYGVSLSPEQTRALLEYLKSL